MEKLGDAHVVPLIINKSLGDLLPTKLDNGIWTKLIKPNERQFFPADFIKPIYSQYIEFNEKINKPLNHQLVGNALPKLYLLLYRIIFNIPDLWQLDAVVKGDNNFATVCCFKHPDRPFVGAVGLGQMQQLLLRMEKGSKQFQESLHNLSDILNYKNISFGVHSILGSVNRFRYLCDRSGELFIQEATTRKTRRNSTKNIWNNGRVR